jgi:hypothetical protein
LLTILEEFKTLYNLSPIIISFGIEEEEEFIFEHKFNVEPNKSV